MGPGPEGAPTGRDPGQQAPGFAGMPYTGEAMQAGNIVQDIMTALRRIERRLQKIEEKLGIADAEPKTATRERSRVGRSREAARTTSRTSPYA